MRRRLALACPIGILALVFLVGKGLPAEPAPAVRVDAGVRGEPISKYIYGQFIEHLGRCIYGGIWAEMLEDRKFYFPVTADYDPYGEKNKGGELPVVTASPWQIVGPADSVTMVEEGSFVGDHTPRVEAESGLRQRDLGVRRGRRYVGYVWLKPARDRAEVAVSLAWGDDPPSRDSAAFSVAGDRYTRHAFAFTAGADTDRAMLEIGVRGGPCFVGTASLMPENNVGGMRADTLDLLKQLDAPIYRWPGGNFVSGYDWRDGIGDRDRRPPRKNPAWTGVEHNDFGIDEFMTFCRELGAEPLVVVNSGLGGVDMAVEEVEYANGGPDTPLGRLRARNGHPEPYGVVWWGIGNEMYGGWQLGHMPLEQYIEKNNEFADALRAGDPSIKLIAVGAVGKWSEGMMQHAADHMDLISEHFYVRDQPDLIAHVAQPRERVRAIAEAHRGYRRHFDSLRGKDIRIALDEWNYWYGPHVFGELGVRYFLKDALGVAAALNEFARHSDMYFMANYAQTVNVIGAVKTTKTDACFATTGLALALYRRHFGSLPLATEASPPLDAMAALSEDGKTLTVAVVNPTRQRLDVPLHVEGARRVGPGRVYAIAGSDPNAFNEPGKPAAVKVEEAAVGDGATLVVAPCSVSLFALPVR